MSDAAATDTDPGAASPARTAADWTQSVAGAQKRGEFLLAYDLARSGLAQHPGDAQLQYRAVLALARSGATLQAMKLYDEYALAAAANEDFAALRARLKKDIALRAGGQGRPALLAEAAAAYEATFEKMGGYYSGVNAATLFLLAGQAGRAAALADAAERAAASSPADTPEKAYYLHATLAELALLRGNAAMAQGELQKAAGAGYDDISAFATTRRQLLEICRARNLPLDVLAPIRIPPVIQYVGHMIAPPGAQGRFMAKQETDVARQIAAFLSDHRPGFAFGSLACGADILFAEACIARGIELNVVLPFDAAEFKEVSVVRGGAGWGDRFERCLARAQDVVFATDDNYQGDDSLFIYGARLAMGLALLRATHLGAEVSQVAVWDGVATANVAGTAVDVAFWQSTGLPCKILVLPSGPQTAGDMGRPAPPSPRPAIQRHVQAILFGDFKGFSKLRDRHVPIFQGNFMRAIAEVLEEHGAEVEYRNTWGDAIYLVMRGPVGAARCALDIQARLAGLDGVALGLPNTPQLRLAAHLGPAFAGYDHVCRTPTFFGAHVTKAARLEPVTPPGEVYVTEPFAAALALEQCSDFRCDYVGHLPMAKGYGELRMYALNRDR